MLAIGRSFLTANLTVAFVLGVAFNAPIALLPDYNGNLLQLPRFYRGIISISVSHFSSEYCNALPLSSYFAVIGLEAPK